MADRVLIIDSQEDLRAELENTLQGYGLECLSVGDGKEGLTAAKEYEPQLIILCVELPRMSGYSVCAKLKKDAALKSIPLFITSQDATDETFQHHKKLKTRAEEYLKKPFTTQELVESLKKYVSIPEVSAHLDDAAIEIDAGDVVDDEVVVVADESQAIEDHTGTEDGVATGAADFDHAMDAVAQGGEVESEVDFDHEDAKTQFAPSAPAMEDEVIVGSDNDLRARLAEAEADRDRARGEAEALRSTASKAKNNGSSAAREVVSLKKEMSQKDHEILELREKLNTLEKSFLGAKDDHIDLEGRIVQVEEEREEARESNEALTSQLADKQTEIADLEGANRGLDEELKATQSSLEERESQLTASEERGKGLEDDLRQEGERFVASANGTIEELQGDLEAYKARSAELSDKKAQLEEQIEALEAGKQDLRGQIGDLEAKLGDAQDQIRRDTEIKRKAAEALGLASGILRGEAIDGSAVNGENMSAGDMGNGEIDFQEGASTST